MVDTATGNSLNRGAPGYHLESLPDGQQVLVNDRTGMVAVTNPYTGQIMYEVPKEQVPGLGATKNTAGGAVTPKAAGGTPGVATQPAQNGPSGATYPPGVTNPNQPPVYKPGVYVPGGGQPQPGTAAAAATTPATGGVTYPPGVTNPRGAPPPPGGGTPRPGGPDASGGTDPNAATPTPAATAQAPVDTSGQRPALGTPGYDLWAMNDMLRKNSMDGWQVTGVVPIQQVKTVKNPDATDLENPYIEQKQNEYIINVTNPNTGDVRTLSFAKVWQGADGGYTDKDPGNGSGYGYQLGDVKQQIKADANAKGHTGQMTIGNTLWGTNAQTGVFEPVPGAPKIDKAWTDVKQITDKDGNKVWYGVDPVDQVLKPVPSMASLTIPKEATAWADMQLIDDGTGTGNKVWYGVDPADKKMKPMPDMPKVIAGPKGPASTTSNGVVYVQKADGSYEPAKGIPDPNPAAGVQQIILGPDGFLYRQTSRGNGQGFDPDTTFTPVPFTDAAKQQAANTASHHKAGEPGTKVINDMVYHVTYRGDSNDSYDIDTKQPATRMPGTGTTTSIATSSDQPYIVQRGPDQNITQVNNPNYQPTDPAKQVAQLSEQANAKLAEIQQKIGVGGYDQEKAQQEFNQWWDTNVEPAKAQIQFSQRKSQEDLQRNNLQVAQNAGNAAVQAASNLHYVGPGFGDLWGKISQGYGTQMPDNITADDINKGLVTQAPDFGDIYDQATAKMLAHISPTAAAIANGGTPGATPSALQTPQDITGQLNRNLPQFQLHGAPPPPPTGQGPAQGAATQQQQGFPIPPTTTPGGFTNWWQQNFVPPGQGAGMPATQMAPVAPYAGNRPYTPYPYTPIPFT